MHSRRDVLVIGSHLYGVYVGCEELPRPGETVTSHDFRPMMLDDGGKGSNQAMCAARLGAATTFVGAVGADAPGQAGLDLLAQNGVDISRVIRVEKCQTGFSIELVDAAGANMIVTIPGASAELSVSHLDGCTDLFQSHRFCLVQFESSGALIAIAAARRAAECRARAILTPSPIESLDRDALSGIDILAPNEAEAAQLLNRTHIWADSAEAARQIHELWDVRNVVLTLGARGCVAFWDGEIIHVPAFEVVPKNTVGAGDCFVGALATGLCWNLNIHDALTLASAVAALSVTHPGAPWASFPHLREIIKFLSERGYTQLARQVEQSSQ
jgi:ribokinase